MTEFGARSVKKQRKEIMTCVAFVINLMHVKVNKV